VPYRDALVTRKDAATVTAQSAPIPGRASEMTQNRAGGFVFEADRWTRLSRFLILGSDAPTYYADAREMTLSNIDGVLACLRDDPLRVVREIVDVSVCGRAPKNDPALYALALCASYGVYAAKGRKADLDNRASALTEHDDPRAVDTRRAAFEALRRVARTGTHVMQFVGFLSSLRGWGPTAAKGLAAWLSQHPSLELQAVKYRQREGWALRDVCRLAHPKIDDAELRALVDWIVHRDLTEEELRLHEDAVAYRDPEAADAARRAEIVERFALSGRKVPGKATRRRHAVRPGAEVVADARGRFRLVEGMYLAREAMDAAMDKASDTKVTTEGAKALAGAAVARVVRSHSLPREAVPTEVLNSREVWDALLEDMPIGAMVRNLNKMTQVGLLSPGSAAAEHVCARLLDHEQIRRARLHPFALLMALKVYGTGRGLADPNNTWTPVPAVNKALNDAFYLAFKAVEPTGLRILQGFDVSGSMNTAFLTAGRDRRGQPLRGPISARVASAAMGAVVDAVEKNVHNVAFCGWSESRSWSNIAREPVPGGWASPNGDWKTMGWRDSIHNMLVPMDIAGRRLDDVCRMMDEMPMGGTDVAAPILYALDKGLEIDLFVTYTDSETWMGAIHPAEALRRYRRETGIAAKMVAVAMTATEYTVADPKDAGSLNVVGFDADAPSIIMDFARR
jgi:60 kDa SS-A/Ro ribonucleoprotein